MAKRSAKQLRLNCGLTSSPFDFVFQVDESVISSCTSDHGDDGQSFTGGAVGVGVAGAAAGTAAAAELSSASASASNRLLPATSTSLETSSHLHLQPGMLVYFCSA